MNDIPAGWLTLIGTIVTGLFSFVTLVFSTIIKRDVNANWTKAQTEIAAQNIELSKMRMAIGGMIKDNTPAEQIKADQAGVDSLGRPPKTIAGSEEVAEKGNKPPP